MGKQRKPAKRKEEVVRRPEGIPARLLLMAALVLAFLVHIAAVWFPFVDDDEPQIQLNPHLQSWHYLPRYFTADVWSHLGCGSNYYRPVFLLWLRLNHCFFGLDPMGWHVAAILLHVLAAWLVYLLAARELNDKIAAGFAAAIFAVHPLTVECVAWISGSTETLEGVLFLGCLLCYLKGSRWSSTASRDRPADGRRPETEHRKLWQAAALLLFALALLAKETAVALPLLVLLYEFRFQSFKVSNFQSGKIAESGETPAALKPETGNVKPETVPGRATGDGGRGTFPWTSVPYFLILAAYLAVRARVLHGMAPRIEHVSLALGVATWPGVLWFYVLKLVAPWPLSLHYNLDYVSRLGLGNFWLPLAALLATGAGLWKWYRREPRVAKACAWCLIPLSPAVAASLRFGHGQLVHDRYLYLPLAGFSMLCALALRMVPSPVAGRRHSANGQPSKSNDLTLPLTQAAALAVVVGIFGITTLTCIGNWSANLALYGQAVSVAPDNAIAQNALGQQLFHYGQLDDGMSHLQLAAAADPESYEVRISLGHAYGQLGNWEEAVRQLRIATRVNPSACAYAHLGDAQRSAGQLTAAEDSYRYALTVPPCPSHLHWALADLLRQEGKLAAARTEYRAELAEPADSSIPDVRQRIDELDRALQPTR